MKAQTFDRPVLDCRLTTTDNPFDPFTQFSEWYKYDCMKGYNSCGILAAMTPVTEDTPDNFYFWRIEDAIDLIVASHPTINFTKVSREPYSYLTANA